MKKEYWELLPVTSDLHYIPDAQEIAEMKEVEQAQKACKHLNSNEEDGCLDCGYGAK